MSTRHCARSQFQFLLQANYEAVLPLLLLLSCSSPGYTALVLVAKPTAVRHLTNIPLICYTWQAATRPWAATWQRMALALCTCVSVCVCYVSGLPPLLVLIFLHFPPVASLRWRSSLAPVVSAYCCAFIVMAMFFVVSFGGIVNAAPPPLPLPSFRQSLLLLLCCCLSLRSLSLMLSVLRLWARIRQR